MTSRIYSKRLRFAAIAVVFAFAGCGQTQGTKVADLVVSTTTPTPLEYTDDEYVRFIDGMHDSQLFGNESESELTRRGKQACQFLAIGEGDIARIAKAIESSDVIKTKQDNVEVGFAMGLASQTLCPEWKEEVLAWAPPTTR